MKNSCFIRERLQLHCQSYVDLDWCNNFVKKNDKLNHLFKVKKKQGNNRDMTIIKFVQKLTENKSE